MRLFETILSANQRAPAGTVNLELPAGDFADALPVVALTCIDTRLNRLIPEVLGVPEEQFIWLRNAGNVITGPLSSTLRSLALASAIKGGKEIAIIGHTDCLVCKTTILKLTEALRALGIDRQRLPENLNEYFGLFASERQNVIRGAEIVRNSPLIGPNIPVHGLLVDLQTAKLEWLVNGYQTLGVATTGITDALKQTALGTLQQTAADALNLLSSKLPDFKPGEMKFPEFKIGETVIDPNKWLSQVEKVVASKAEQARTEAGPGEASQAALSEFEKLFDKALKYKVIGSDQKVYGPINGLKILEWIAEGRINWQTPSQAEGSIEWRPLSMWTEALRRVPVPLPPKLKAGWKGPREEKKPR